MIRLVTPIILIFVLALAYTSSSSAELKNGHIQTQLDGTLKVWHAENEEWLNPEMFWRRYAASRGGLTWGTRSEYPPYKQVKEFDTLLIKLESGPCLMEFFHTRWRRANDVRRWDPAFNEFGGCPYVFD